MDSYIVRIYRKGRGDSSDLAGLVEMVGCKERMSFRSFPELTSVLHRMLEHSTEEGVVNLQKSTDSQAGDTLGLSLVAGRKG